MLDRPFHPFSHSLHAATRVAALARQGGARLDQDGAFPAAEVAALAEAGLLAA
ncbi:acyl-CoA dehydrogenase, partial [Pseudoroseomonas wenyumeiae]